MHCPCSFTLALTSLFPDNSRSHARRLRTIYIQTELSTLPGKRRSKLEFQIVMFIVLVSFKSQFTTTLAAIQQIRGLEPQISQRRNIQVQSLVIFLYIHLPCFTQTSQEVISNSRFVKNSSYFLAIFNLNKHTRILCKKNLYPIFLGQIREVDIQSQTIVGKTHFQQGCNHTPRRNIMSCQNITFLHQTLYRGKSISKIICILYIRSHFAYTV